MECNLSANLPERLPLIGILFVIVDPIPDLSANACHGALDGRLSEHVGTRCSTLVEPNFVISAYGNRDIWLEFFDTPDNNRKPPVMFPGDGRSALRLVGRKYVSFTNAGLYL